MKKIVIGIFKGGNSKSTLSQIIASGLKRKKQYKVLLVDLDQQHTLTDFLNANPNGLGIIQALENPGRVKECIQHTDKGDIIAGSEYFHVHSNYIKNLDAINNMLTEVSDNYDVAIIDTPPAMSPITLSATAAADYIIIPVRPDKVSINGMSLYGKSIKEVCDATKKSPLIKVVITQANYRAKSVQAVDLAIQTAAPIFNAKVYKTRLGFYTAYSDSQLLGKDIFEEFSGSKAVDQLNGLMDEIIVDIENI